MRNDAMEDIVSGNDAPDTGLHYTQILNPGTFTKSTLAQSVPGQRYSRRHL